MDGLLSWLDAWEGRRVLVVGDLMLDRYIWGEPDRISPEAPVLVLQETLDEVRPGGAASVASFLHHLDARVVLAGVWGDDSDGRTLRHLLAGLPVNTDCVLTDPDRVTTTKQRFIGRAAQRQPHQILRVDRESRQPVSAATEFRLMQQLLNQIPDCDAVLISDYAKGVCTPGLLRGVIQAARGLRVPVLVDPCRGVDYSRYTGATLVAPNRVAAELESGQKLRDPDSIQFAARELRQRLQLDAAVVTLDRDGLAYATSDETGLVSCRLREVCDVTGAGDMVLAVLGLCQASKVPLVESLHLANAAAGLEVERFGVEPVSRAEIAIEVMPHRDHKMITIDELIRRTVAWRQSGQTIVLTNGCFDLLHVGHLSLLEQAARLGSVLIVAINSDDSIRNLKGADRPLIGQHERARMLSALDCVDSVVVFDDPTPIPLLKQIRPHVLVKGDEYSHQEVVGAEVVTAYGGRIITVPMVPGFSTTRLVNDLKRRFAYPQ